MVMAAPTSSQETDDKLDELYRAQTKKLKRRKQNCIMEVDEIKKQADRKIAKELAMVTALQIEIDKREGESMRRKKMKEAARAGRAEPVDEKWKMLADKGITTEYKTIVAAGQDVMFPINNGTGKKLAIININGNKKLLLEPGVNGKLTIGRACLAAHMGGTILLRFILNPKLSRKIVVGDEEITTSIQIKELTSMVKCIVETESLAKYLVIYSSVEEGMVEPHSRSKFYNVKDYKIVNGMIRIRYSTYSKSGETVAFVRGAQENLKLPVVLPH